MTNGPDFTQALLIVVTMTNGPDFTQALLIVVTMTNAPDFTQALLITSITSMFVLSKPRLQTRCHINLLLPCRT
jgi:hypothetical protein